jgi:hypothetical protein
MNILNLRTSIYQKYPKMDVGMIREAGFPVHDKPTDSIPHNFGVALDPSQVANPSAPP